MVLPSAVVLDPKGRGFYLIDEVNSPSLTASLLRFVNTTAAAVTLAGTTIQPGGINLIAGGGNSTSDGSAARDTDLGSITGLTIDPAGDIVYVSSTPGGLGAIIAINLGTQTATVRSQTIAAGKIATIFSSTTGDIRAITIHPTTKDLYYIGASATNARVVFRLDGSGTQTVYAGGGNPTPPSIGDGDSPTNAKLITPTSLAMDSTNLLIADGGDARSAPGRVRKVTNGKISTLATFSFPSNDTQFPNGITLGPDGNAYVSLGNAQQIVRLSLNGNTQVVAGDNSAGVCDLNATPTCGDGGAAISARFSLADSVSAATITLAADSKGIYIPDYRYRRIRYVNLSNAAVTMLGTSIGAQMINTIVGSGLLVPYDNSPATAAELESPTGVAADANGNLFIAEKDGNRLRFVNRTDSPVKLFAGTPSEQTVAAGQIVSLNKDAGAQNTDDIAVATFQGPQGLVVTDKGLYIVDSQNGALIKNQGSVTGKRSGILRFLNTSASDVTLYPNAAAKIVVPPGMIKLIAGIPPGSTIPTTIGDGGPATSAIVYPTDVDVDSSGTIYIADQGNNRIRKINASSGVISTVALDTIADGDGAPTTLSGPTGITLDSTGRLYIADTKNDRVLRQNAVNSNAYTAIANKTKNISQPRDVAVDNNKILVTNSGTSQVLQIIAPDNTLGSVVVLAGTGTPGYGGDDNDADRALLNLPTPGPTETPVTAGIATLTSGVTVFTDTKNHRVRLLVRNVQPPMTVASVSAASYKGDSILAPESITAAFGSALAIETKLATQTPLPTSLAGTTVKIKDSTGREASAPLFFVSQAQVNYEIPAGLVTGDATVTVTNGAGRVSVGAIKLDAVAPGIFSANSSGQGVAAAVALRVKPDFTQIYEQVVRWDPAQSKFVAIPIDLSNAADSVYLVLYGTGIRGRSSLSAVSAKIDGVDAQVVYADKDLYFVGLDQINILIPQSLAGRNKEVNLVLTVDTKTANTVTVAIK